MVASNYRLYKLRKYVLYFSSYYYSISLYNILSAIKEFCNFRQAHYTTTYKSWLKKKFELTLIFLIIFESLFSYNVCEYSIRNILESLSKPLLYHLMWNNVMYIHTYNPLDQIVIDQSAPCENQPSQTVSSISEASVFDTCQVSPCNLP